jgi:hypothetical protein
VSEHYYPGKNDPLTVHLDECPAPAETLEVDIVKTNDANDDGEFSNEETAPEPGADVDFRITITNSSDSTVDGTITELTDTWNDQELDLLDHELSCDGDINDALAPGESITCDFTVADYAPDAGESLDNTVEVTLVNDDHDLTDDANDDSTVNVDPITPPDEVLEVDIDKTNDANDDGEFSNEETAPEPGADVDFRITITNSSDSTVDGTITELTDTWNDQELDLLDHELSCDGDINDALAPGESITCDFTVADYAPDAGESLDNTVEVTLVNDDHDLTDDANDDSTVNVDPITPPDEVLEVDIDKTNDANDDGEFSNEETAPEPGADVDFRITITNSSDSTVDGTITELTDTWNDQELDLLDHELSCDGDINDALAPGESITCDFTVADYAPDAGESLDNTVEVTLVNDDHDLTDDANDDSTVNVDPITPPTDPNPDIAIEKTAVGGVEFDDNDSPFVVFEDGNGSHDITYEYEITNIGDEDLTELSLVDDKIGDLSTQFQAAVGDGPFAAGESVTVTAIHEDVTADDFDEGLLTNVAIVSGDGVESGETVTDSDDETVFDVDVLGVIPAITVDKTVVDGADEDEDGNWVVRLAEGETTTITYSFLVSNPSEDGLTDLTLVDDKIGDLSAELEQAVIDAYDEPILPAGGSVTVTADYETTAEDFANGSTTNVVVAEGIGELSGVTVSDSDDETVFIVEVMAEVDVREEAEPEDDPEVEAEDEVEVAAKVETLPRTGLDSANMLLLGLLFTLLGAAGIVLSPGRRNGPGQALSM